MPRQEVSVNGIRWVYVVKPNKEDVEGIRQLFPFHPFVLADITSPTLHPFVADFEDHLFLILHFPIIHPGRQPNRLAEVDFLIARDLLVTITYFEFPRFEEIFRASNLNMQFKEQSRGHTGFLLYHIIDRLFQEHLKDLDMVGKEVTKIESKIFDRRSSLSVEDIAHIRRDIIDFRRPLRSQATVLASFRDKAEKFYGKHMAPYLLDLLVTEERVLTLLENQKETMDVLYQTHESLLSSRISRIIATLTIFAAVILPLSLIASIWGMNQKVMPLRDNPHDFWIVIGIMAVTAIALLLFFRQKRWL